MRPPGGPYIGGARRQSWRPAAAGEAEGSVSSSSLFCRPRTHTLRRSGARRQEGAAASPSPCGRGGLRLAAGPPRRARSSRSRACDGPREREGEKGKEKGREKKKKKKKKKKKAHKKSRSPITLRTKPGNSEPSKTGAARLCEHASSPGFGEEEEEEGGEERRRKEGKKTAAPDAAARLPAKGPPPASAAAAAAAPSTPPRAPGRSPSRTSGSAAAAGGPAGLYAARAAGAAPPPPASLLPSATRPAAPRRARPPGPPPPPPGSPHLPARPSAPPPPRRAAAPAPAAPLARLPAETHRRGRPRTAPLKGEGWERRARGTARINYLRDFTNVVKSIPGIGTFRNSFLECQVSSLQPTLTALIAKSAAGCHFTSCIIILFSVIGKSQL
ncbi:atherin-like isoform X2 [Gallus gallus]|uniref:atherin-like isoform X2 n=1 Tax=Gallus gallus TaxID=9031 RepID=UPI001EFFB2A8|nr:atherin-like isoform X2 [Gallus gallus]